MSLRLEMLQAARLAPRLLGESTELVRAFLLRQQNPDGGFKNRLGESDLYYSVFGIEALLSLPDRSVAPVQIAVEGLESYLRKFGAGEGLDLVHLCCLIRCWADLITGSAKVGRATPQLTSANKITPPPELQKVLPPRLENYRAKDGGYNPIAGSAFSTPYGCFLALGAYQDMHTWSADAHVRDLPPEIPDASALPRCLIRLQNENGAWDNTGPALFTGGATNASAAAVATLQQLAAKLNPAAGEWLLARCHPQGGFLAGPNAPLPDLLSTATALHALAMLQVSVEPIREKCLDFLDSLWTNEGSFHGHWLDDHLDCEYTFYALLALGHLGE